MAVHHEGTAMTPKTAKQLADEDFFAARSDTMTTIRVFERSEQPQTMFGLLNKNCRKSKRRWSLLHQDSIYALFNRS